ncbi:MAG: phosphoribosylformylglycinamidine cyclo-ligase [Acidimicrobiia bacterium]
MSGETYATSGVSLEAADETVDQIKSHVRSTFRPEVLGDIGGFGGLFALGNRYRDPVLVSSTDGVGTKALVARAMNQWGTVGLDLVAMCADDIVVQGAEPLFFLDYVGVGTLRPEVVESIVAGIALGCREAGCALVGGEVAEHPGAGDDDNVELAGFVVGVVERDALITGAAISPGDVLIGLASPGLRSNGYSLARRVLLERAGLPLDAPAWDGADTSVGTELLRPSVIYARALVELTRAFEVHGLAHITGGGIPGNLVRVLHDGVDAVVRRGTWPVPRIFDEIARLGGVALEEMDRVFNRGVGMIAAVPAAIAPDVIAHLAGNGHESWIIGEVVPGSGRVLML